MDVIRIVADDKYEKVDLDEISPDLLRKIVKDLYRRIQVLEQESRDMRSAHAVYGGCYQ